MAKELQFLNAQLSNASAADAYRQILFPGRVKLHWVQWAHSINIAASPGAGYWRAYLELLRSSTYVPLGSAAGIFGTVVVTDAIAGYIGAGDISFSGAARSGYANLDGLISDGRQGLYLASYNNVTNGTHQISLTVAFKLI